MALQPTNAGIDYQQRVSALFLLLMLCGRDLADYLPDGSGPVVWVQLEGADSVDDMVLGDQIGHCYVQIKRNLSFSIKEDSELRKTMRQFVRQTLSEAAVKDRYYLITSPASSDAVSDRLSRLFNAIRTGNSLDMPQLNQKDKKLLLQILDMLRQLFMSESGSMPDEKQILEVCQRIHIVVYDVEEGKGDERLALTLLHLLGASSPALVWRALIAEALSLAANRMKAELSYLQRRYQTYLIQSTQKDTLFETEQQGEAQIGYDIVLGGSEQLIRELAPDAPTDAVVLLQLYRFDESGKKQISTFEPRDKLLMAHEIPIRVIHRCSSLVGIERYLKDHAEALEGRNIISFLGHGNGQEDDHPQAQLHKKWLNDQLAQLGSQLSCIHCGESISQPCYLVEVDNIKERPKVGRVHLECLRPVDRVLGMSNSPIYERFDHLKDFDYEAWLVTAGKGQRLFGGVEKLMRDQSVLQMFWCDDMDENTKGRFCIQDRLSSGEVTYVTQRGRVVRGSEVEMQRQAEFMNQVRQEHLDDPLGYSNQSWSYGPYSQIAPRMEVGEEFLTSLACLCVPFASDIHELYDREGEYYAPLSYLTIAGQVVVVDGAVFMLTNPLLLPKYFENWDKKMGVDLASQAYSVQTLKDDHEFDRFMSSLVRDGIIAIVDPMFGEKNDLLRGVIIRDFNALTGADGEREV